METALLLKKSIKENLKQLLFEGNSIVNMKDLCIVNIDEIEVLQPHLRTEALTKNKVKNTNNNNKYRAFSFQNLLNNKF